MMPTASERFVRWAWALDLGDLPSQVRHAACRHTLDGLGTALAASRLGTAPYAKTVADQIGGPQEASIVDGGRVAAPVAALANGILLHALDYDDTHAESLVHPTAAVVPAALAAAEHAGASGAEYLTACVAGYELVTRLGAAVRHGFHTHGFHATSVCGVFSAALVGARLWNLPADTAVAALGIAGSFASGSLQFLQDGSATKQLHPGWAAHAGLMAARLAAAGASGPARIFEGENGFFNSYAGQNVDPEVLVADLGHRWETARITLKPYPACQLSHASLDAVRLLRDRIGSLDAVEEITFEVPSESVPIVCEPVETKLRPRTAYEAKFSLQWCAATLLIDGRLDVESFAEDRLTRPEVLRLAARVRHRGYESDLVAASAPGRVSVRRRGLTDERAEVVASSGTPESPLSDKELREKFVENVGDASRAREIAEIVFDLEGVDDVGTLATVLRSRRPVVA
jgi:2-methylcitrate dehydratase PrpD